MGWQLIPLGIGWRSFDKTLEEGRFACANPRCKGRTEPTQRYRLRRARNWFTVLFIPVIPLNTKGVYVECRSCKSVFHAAVLRESSGSSGRTPSPAEAFGPATAAPISPADVFSSAPASSATAGLAPTTHEAPPPSVPVEEVAPHWWLELADDRRVDVAGPTVVGRAPSSAAVSGASLCTVDDPSMTSSKSHAVLYVDSGVLRVRDLGSANGTRVIDGDGRERHLRGDDSDARPGSTVWLGEVAVRVVQGASA